VGGAGSVSRKKGLSWQQPTASGSKEQHRPKQQVVSCSEQSEDEVTAETSLLPHREEQPAEEKVSIFGNPLEITFIACEPSGFRDNAALWPWGRLSL
jgi:hypothetical protein